jgi:hypothetical protein
VASLKFDCGACRGSDTAQPMWKKSTARIVATCACGKMRQQSSRAAGRGQWWRAFPFHIQAPDPAKMTSAELSAAIAHTRAKAEHDIDLYFRVLTQYNGPDGWAQSSRGGFYMTKQELHAFFKDYLTLQWKYGHTAHDARPVALRFFALPDDTALDEGSGKLRLQEP